MLLSNVQCILLCTRSFCTGPSLSPIHHRIVSTCQSNGDFYQEQLGGDNKIPGIQILDQPEGARSAYWLYTFAFEKPGFVLSFIEFMKGEGIAASQVRTRSAVAELDSAVINSA